MNDIEVPPIAFLGVCDRFVRSTNIVENLFSQNLIGLRNEIVSPIYPLPIDGENLKIVLAIYYAQLLADVRVNFVGEDNEPKIWIDINLQRFEQQETPPDFLDPNILPVGETPAWSTLVVSFPDTTISKPAKFTITLSSQDSTVSIGEIRFLYVKAAPLTDDRVAAIRSDPNAPKSVRLILRCKNCNDTLTAYAALDRTDAAKDVDAIWYQDLPVRFICECGQTNEDLSYIRENLHALLSLLGAQSGSEVSFTRLYELTALDTIAKRFRRLLDSSPDEPEVQEFLENNPTLFHRFSPTRLLKKPPLLTQYVADFAVLATNGDLILIEIEKPEKRLLKKDGNRSSSQSIRN